MPFLSALPTVDPQSVVDGAKLWSGPGYIDGLQMQWVSATAVTVSSGRAYIPSLGYYLDAPNAIALTGLVLTASTWHHLYLYDNAGTPAVECVTTAPAAPYSGTARAKTGDTSRRYIGSVLTDASAAISFLLPQQRYGWTDLFAAVTTQQNFSQGAFVVVEYNALTRDVAGEWNSAAWTFTPIERGLYAISAFAHPEIVNDGGACALDIFVNGVETYRVAEQAPRSPTNMAGLQIGSACLVALNAGDAVTVRIFIAGSGTTSYIDAIASLSYLSIYRMQ